MPMIDVYVTAGTFPFPHGLAKRLATELMIIEQVPDIPLFRKNTAAFVHDLPAPAVSNVEGDSNYVRVQVLTNAGALDRDKQLAVVSRFAEAIADAANDPSLADRMWCSSPKRSRAVGASPDTHTPTPSSLMRPEHRSRSYGQLTPSCFR